MPRYAVVMDKWLEVYAQHARTDVPVLPTKAHLPSVSAITAGHIKLLGKLQRMWF